MKISICDVCEHEGRLVASKYRTGFKGGTKSDLCEEHRNYFKDCKTPKEFAKKSFELMYGGNNACKEA